MHPQRVAVGVTVLLAVLGGACGDDEATSTKTSSPGVEVSGSDTFPTTVEHALGTTEVADEPQRVVTVGVTEHDTVLALGVTPVGVTDWYGDQPYATWPWAQDELGAAEPEVLSSADGLQYERIAALDPDLIIGTNAGLDDVMYEQLSAIAPTIAHPAGAEAYFAPWDQQALIVGQALGRETEVRNLIDEIKAAFAEAAGEHPEFAGTHIIFLQNAFYDGEAVAYQDGLSTAFLTDLGFTIPPELAAFERDGEGAQAYIPLEQLSVLDTAEVLLWATEAPGDRAALEAQPLYSSLAAVKDGHLVFTDGVTAGAIYFSTVLSLPFVLEHLVPALATTIAGDGPATIDAS